MSNTIVPLNAFDHDEVRNKGQVRFVEQIAQSGAYGIEIRKELFKEGDLPLEELRNEIDTFGLFSVYSAPIELWSVDGSLNKTVLRQVFAEADMLGARWLKVSLGHYQDHVSDCLEMNVILSKYDNINLMVENDQTLYGGNIESLAAFFERTSQLSLPVKMTFDIGNWHYTDQDIELAYINLEKYVCYVHLKEVEKQDAKLVTVPLSKQTDAAWINILKRFPGHITKALEFPMLPDEIQAYLELVQLEKLRN